MCGSLKTEQYGDDFCNKMDVEKLAFIVARKGVDVPVTRARACGSTV